MHTIELTDDELQLLHAALHSYLDDFGHEEADVLRQIKELLETRVRPAVATRKGSVCGSGEMPAPADGREQASGTKG